MKRFWTLAVFPLLLAACATPPREATVVEAPAAIGGELPQMEFALTSGRYRCSAGDVVDVERDARDVNRLAVRWHGRNVALARNASASGLPRFENASDGLVWIDLPWKSYLLDHKSGKPLASECRPA